VGLYKSTDGGVDWTYILLSPAPGQSNGQDVYYPQIDPYNSSHLILTGHENPTLYQSFDAGNTWSSITLNSGMTGSLSTGGTAFAYFVNTGNSTTTANTWLWIEQGTGGYIGTWRTNNAGSTWTQVNSNEHGHGTSALYQPCAAGGSCATAGTIFMGGVYFQAVGGYSSGIIFSNDYGVTWNWAASKGQFGSFGANVITGTSKNLYAANGAALEISTTASIDFMTSPLPGTGATWTMGSNPSSWTWGVGNFAVVNDGTHNIVLATTWGSGLWRYVEP
jgi:hypothetical protein